jgi:V8-like Glu-specific endopeptidase
MNNHSNLGLEDVRKLQKIVKNYNLSPFFTCKKQTLLMCGYPNSKGYRMKKTQLGLLALTTIFNMQAMASTTSEDIVYGEDNRIETYEASIEMQKLASSTAGMFRNVKGVNVGKYTILPPQQLGEEMGLCKGERFAEQSNSVVCSGFLVGPDLLVTAGHCIQNQEDCNETSWVFDYKLQPKTNRADVMVGNDKVYKCKKVVEAKLFSDKDGTRIDYSLVKLDRAVIGKKPLKFRTSSKVATNTDIVVIGHPSGLPQKVAAGAKVLLNNDDHYFQTNLDTFGGNSGSAVFDEKTGQVEGILVRGAKDYERAEGGCLKVHKTADQITDFARYGESVSRITDIKSLKYRGLFFKAAQEGDIAKMEELVKAGLNPVITNDDLNTAMHTAASSGNIAVINKLAGMGVNLNAQNLLGETALHLAAFHNNKDAIKELIANGASTLIKDKNGNTPVERTMFLAFGTRKALKIAQEKEKREKRKNL